MIKVKNPIHAQYCAKNGIKFYKQGGYDLWCNIDACALWEFTKKKEERGRQLTRERHMPGPIDHPFRRR